MDSSACHILAAFSLQNCDVVQEKRGEMLSALIIFPLSALLWLMLSEHFAPMEDQPPYREG
ncbi:hypothetical protein TP2_13670 [Thioclava pacifica DSM 10166]|uniref:Uncharacterized protein n=1 Tax=Thioclava pacifica DSM 10166 TaxID=1353537 RepID=A0A074JNF9_9RHOB|nr:hypothetical protein TP2_13670 [Thioclava pacifica DSM 10166]